MMTSRAALLNAMGGMRKAFRDPRLCPAGRASVAIVIGCHAMKSGRHRRTPGRALAELPVIAIEKDRAKAETKILAERRG